MASFNLTKANLDSSIKDNEILLIDFWASWCGPCRMFGPIFEKVSEKHKDIAFAKCNTEEAADVAASFGVSSIPTLAIFREGVLLYAQPGALPEAGLEDLIKQVRALDMEKVKAEATANA
jgi:thioredoxin 1